MIWGTTFFWKHPYKHFGLTKYLKVTASGSGFMNSHHSPCLLQFFPSIWMLYSQAVTYPQLSTCCHLRWRLIYLLLHLLKMSLLNSCMPWLVEMWGTPPQEGLGKVLEKSPSWACHLFTSDRTRSYSLSWGQTSNHQHLTSFAMAWLSEFPMLIVLNFLRKKKWKPWITSWRLKIQSLYKRILLEILDVPIAAWCKLNLHIPSPFFHHLSRLDITNNLPNLTHLTIYVYIYMNSINSYNFSIISATKPNRSQCPLNNPPGWSHDDPWLLRPLHIP